jgi:hypothetical protein
MGMNFKQIIGVLGFLVVGFMPKAISQQAELIIDNDTFYIGKKLVTPDHKITSNMDKMGRSDCIGSHGGWPIWKIEKDSLFLTKIVVAYKEISPEINEYTEVLADLSKEFGKKYVNGRVFAKEINMELIGLHIDTFDTDTALFYNETMSFLTIKHGKLVKHIEFTGTIQWAGRDAYYSKKLVVQKTDWKTQPHMPLNGGTKVVAQIAVDDKGKLTKIKIIEGGDKRWNKQVLNIINRLSRWEGGHISFTYHDRPNIRYKKEKVILIVKKPH